MSNVVQIDQHRAAKDGPRDWRTDLRLCAAKAKVVRSEHALEQALIHYEQADRRVTEAWWDGPDDLKQRIGANNERWDLYIAICLHLANMPAKTRTQAELKRNTIGKGWLMPGLKSSELLGPMREGCARDDHLLPPSLRLQRD